MASERVWLITGASSGFGQELAKVVLSKGDRVIATSRNPEKITGLTGAKSAHLDQNESLDKVKADVEKIIAIYGTVDIVVNNAAYVQGGTVEESTPEEMQTQFQANVFGPINVYRAILPHIRAKGTGTLVTMGSMAAWFTLNGCNLYNASKAAIRWLVLGMAEEIKPFGIKHCLVEPGFFRTQLLNPTGNFTSTKTSRIPEYDEINKNSDAAFTAFHGSQLGDPVKGCEILYDVITSSGVAAGRELPSLLPLGSDATGLLTKTSQDTIDQVKELATISGMSDIPQESK
ncbi:hypothetical protein F5Y16DRAFT_381614 [Xylariaceae sp. FL0255]|nr:hypothetical protein F5Y16DRAFT_381614 [Xylariaceae sp. FL0255]